MQTTTSKLTSKYQATIPAPVRKILELNAGDAVAFDIEEGKISLRKASRLDLNWAGALESILTEWDAPEDDEAYRDL